MQINTKLPSSRLLMTLFICMLSIILLQNYNFAYSFTFNVISVLISFTIIFLFYIPTSIIKKKTNLDFLSFANSKTPAAIVFISAFYCIYFVYAITYFLFIYADMFVNKLNKEANIYIVTLLLLVTAVYAAYKGVNAITRYSIFIFVFTIISLLIIFSGNISNIDFINNSFEFTSEKSNLINNVSYFLTPSFSVVIFASVSEYTKNFKIRQIVLTIGLTFIVFILSLFFLSFCLGDYAFQQSYQFYLLSKIAHIGVISGIESFYLAFVTATVFLTISLMLTGITKSTGKSDNISIILMFAIIIAIFFVCVVRLEGLSEILLNHTVLNTLSFIGAVIIPTMYLLVYRGKMNV